MKSSRFTIDKVGLKKIGRGALIAGGGAILTYMMETIPAVDFGNYTAIIVAVSSISINACRKYLSEY